nr:LysM peptidoglycan-binding domain-containing protein [Anaerolineaceae bacterium]
DPGDLPAFEPYGIADEGMTLRDIANKFGVDLDTLARYNDLLPDDILEPGEWVLIPRERTYWYRY